MARLVYLDSDSGFLEKEFEEGVWIDTEDVPDSEIENETGLKVKRSVELEGDCVGMPTDRLLQ